MKDKKTKPVYVSDGNDVKIRVYCPFDDLAERHMLVPNKANPNVHPVEQINRLALNIAGHGWRQFITVSKRSGLIVSGHARLLAAEKLNLTHVPVSYQNFKSKAQELAVLISDNVIAELATTSGPAMADILLELDRVNYDLLFTGLDKNKIEKFMDGPVNIPASEKLELGGICPKCGQEIRDII